MFRVALKYDLRNAFVLPQASQRQYVLSTMNDTNCELLMPVVAFLTDENRAVIGFDDLTWLSWWRTLRSLFLDHVSDISWLRLHD